MTDNRPDDDILDERIRALTTAQYHAPEGSVPRDAMWAQIAAARRAARTGATTDAPVHDAAVIPLAPRRRSRTVVMGWSALLAAGLVLGIALEREFLSKPGTPSQLAVVPHSDSAPVVAQRESTGIDSARRGAPRVRETAPAPAPRSRNVEPRATERVAVATPPKATREPRDLPALPDSTVQTFYRTAAMQTLAQAEALLTTYRSAENVRDPQAMQQAARWARDVLSSTRLLLDSPAGRDPQMRSLFTDLELILAQIVQLSGMPLQARERELIDHAMRDRDLLPRIRSAVPAGLATS
ncbi:MAG: hypothetical protein ACJ79A_08975 [Gemmatimonadaceae bacterium]